MDANGNSTPKALLLAIQTPDISPELQAETLDELQDLALTLGYKVMGRVVQHRPHFHPGTVFGSGKLQEIREEARRLEVDTVIFDGNLSPSQGQNLERAIKVMAMDRTQLILDIFSQNASTREARTQVELAQMEYMLPRLVGMWAHLDRERGGIGGSRGAGEKQVDIDRTLVRHRIGKLRKELRHLAQERSTQMKGRRNCLQVSLVGYTNAGKSTLMRGLTDADVLVEDKLFATLDPTTRILMRENRPQILISDTVGFIKHLPHQLVASFRSTLKVVGEADLLLNVVDLSHEAWQEHIATTEQVLEEIGAHTIPRLIIFNKTDQVDPQGVEGLLARRQYPDALFFSALKDDPEELRSRITAHFDRLMVTEPFLLGYKDYGELSKIYRWSRVDAVRYEEDGIHLTVTTTPANLRRIRERLPVAPEPMLQETR